MKIFGCFSWPFNDIENTMNFEEGFSWCCSSWSFHEATEFMVLDKPMVIPLLNQLHSFFINIKTPFIQHYFMNHIFSFVIQHPLFNLHTS